PELIGGNHPATIGPSSPLGVYLRQSILAFNRLDLAQVERVGRRLVNFLQPSSSENTDKFTSEGNFCSYDGEPTVFQRVQPYSSAQDEYAPRSSNYLSHHLDLLGKSFFLCSLDAIVSYFSRNFKNRLPDMVLKEWSQPVTFQALPKSKISLCSSRYET